MEPWCNGPRGSHPATYNQIDFLEDLSGEVFDDITKGEASNKINFYLFRRDCNQGVGMKFTSENYQKLGSKGINLNGKSPEGAFKIDSGNFSYSANVRKWFYKAIEAFLEHGVQVECPSCGCVNLVHEIQCAETCVKCKTSIVVCLPTCLTVDEYKSRNIQKQPEPIAAPPIIEKPPIAEKPKSENPQLEYFNLVKTIVYDLSVSDDEITDAADTLLALGLSKEQIRSIHARIFAMAIKQFNDDQWFDDIEVKKLHLLWKCLDKLGWAPGQSG